MSSSLRLLVLLTFWPQATALAGRYRSGPAAEDAARRAATADARDADTSVTARVWNNLRCEWMGGWWVVCLSTNGLVILFGKNIA
jgi:hypothetical protein